MGAMMQVISKREEIQRKREGTWDPATMVSETTAEGVALRSAMANPNAPLQPPVQSEIIVEAQPNAQYTPSRPAASVIPDGALPSVPRHWGTEEVSVESGANIARIKTRYFRGDRRLRGFRFTRTREGKTEVEYHLFDDNSTAEARIIESLRLGFEVQTDIELAVAFLRLWPTSFIHLTAIHINPVTHEKDLIEAQSFNRAQLDNGSVARWLEARQGCANLYFNENELSRQMTVRTKKSDIRAGVGFAVDIDVPEGMNYQEGIEKLLAYVDMCPHKPSGVIVSGGGVQVQYLLQEPVLIDGDLAKTSEFERYSRKLQTDYSELVGVDGKVDATQSVEHIFRLPGTINVPDAKKIARGRQPAFARVDWMDWDLRYPIREFKQSEKPKREASRGNAELPDSHDCITPDQLELLLSALDPTDYRDYAKWLPLMMASHHATDGHGREGFIQWSISDQPYANDREKIGRAWDGLQLDRSDNVTIGTLYHEVKQAGRDDLIKQISDDANVLILSQSNWPQSARKFIARMRCNLHYHNGDWLDYCRGAYRDIEDDAIKAEAHKFLDSAKARVLKDREFVLVPFEPNNNDVAELVGALKRETHVSREALWPPCWLPEHTGPMPKSDECISFPNGILHLPSAEFHPPTPNFFTRNAVEFNFDPNAPEPKVWFNTVNEWWHPRENGNPSENVATLQEIMGYLLVPDTSQQKMFFVLGPPRSGKGVISRTLTQLVGQSNAAFPSMSTLGGEFGRMPLIGKQLAVISELKVGRKDDPSALAAILLAISGEDNVSVNRKNKGFWEGKLNVRFLFLGNSIPKFADDGTALGNRLVILRMSNSFLGKEDLTLEARIKDELPGILNWAIAGWRRLRKRGHFAETVDGLEAKAEFIRLASPVLSFVSERCTLGPDEQITKQELYDKFKEWCSDNGRLPESKEEFGAALAACCAGQVRDYRPEEHLSDGTVKRPHKWKGIGLIDAHVPF